MTDLTEGANSNKSDTNYAELLEALEAFSVIPKTVRLTYLLRLHGIRSFLIAEIREIDEKEVNRQLKEVEELLQRHIEQLVDSYLSRREKSDTEPETFTAIDGEIKRLFETMPMGAMITYHAFKKFGTWDRVQKEIGFDRQNMMFFYDTARRKFHEYMDSLMRRLLLYLLEIGEADCPAPLKEIRNLALEAKRLGEQVADAGKILEALQTDSFLTKDDVAAASEEKFPLAGEELSHAETMLGHMEPYMRVVFQLEAVEFPRDEISLLLHIDEQDLKTILREVRDRLATQLERLVVGFLQHRMKLPHAPRMKRREILVAKSVLQEISADSQNAFAHFMATGSSREEVAETLGLTVAQVSRRVKRAQKTIRRRAVRAAVAAVLQGEPVETARARIFTQLRREVVSRADIDISESSPTMEPTDPSELTDAHRHEMPIAWSLLNPQQQEIFALCKALQREESRVAQLLRISVNDIPEQLRETRAQLIQFLLRSIVGMLRTREHETESVPITDTALETARAAYLLVPEKNRPAFERSLLTGDSVEEIAEQLGITPEEADRWIEKARFFLGFQIEVLLISWLREEENGQTRAERILTDIQKRLADEMPVEAILSESSPEPEVRYIRAEADEMERVIQRMEFEVREAFVLGFGATLDLPDIARIQKTEEQVVVKRLRKGVETVRESMERLIVAWLCRRFKQPNAPRLKWGEVMAAEAAFEHIPKKSRKPYILDRIRGKSVKEIAGQMQISTEEVEHRLEEAGQSIIGRALDLSACTMRVVVHGRPVGEILLGDPKRIRFGQDVWLKAGVQIPAENLLTETPVIETPPKKVVYEDIPAKESQVKKSGTVMASFSGIGLGMSQMEGMIKGVLASIWATGFMALAAPFLWVMSVLISGQISGFAFIRTAPTLEARRWLMAKLFYIYSLLFVGPLASLVIISNLGIANAFKWKTLLISSWVLLLFLIVIVAFRTACFYNKFCILQNLEQKKHYDFKKLHFIVNFGFTIHTLIYSQIIWENAQEILIATYQLKGFFEKTHFLLLIVGIGIIHTASYCMFRYFLRISKDEKAFLETPPIVISEKAYASSRRILELLRLLPFALFPILANLLHVIVAQEHVLRSSIELVVFSIWWSMVWRRNTLKSNGKWKRIMISFFGQAGIMLIMRLYFF